MRASGGAAALAAAAAVALGVGLESSGEPTLEPRVGPAPSDERMVEPGADRARASPQPRAPTALSTNVGLARVGWRIPTEKAIAAARRYAARREGLVSFAVVDNRGRLHGLRAERGYVSASIVKALLLAAELQRLERNGAPLDATTRDLLARMITWSDNVAADAIYARVGDAGLTEVARRAGMSRFSVVGHWSVARVTAADMATFFSRLERVLPESRDDFAKGLLGSVVEEQSWGIPEAARGWRVRFKGGWRATDLGQLVHQAAELRRGGERISVAVLTDAQPSTDYAIATVRGIAERLLPSPSGR